MRNLEVTRTSIFPAQYVQVVWGQVCFEDIYGNCESVSFKEMGVSEEEFAAMTPEERARKLANAYGR